MIILIFIDIIINSFVEPSFTNSFQGKFDINFYFVVLFLLISLAHPNFSHHNDIYHDAHHDVADLPLEVRLDRDDLRRVQVDLFASAWVYW